MTECDTCIRYSSHGGKCWGDRKKNGSMCLHYKEDERGEIRYFKNVKIPASWEKETRIRIGKDYTTESFYKMPEGWRILNIDQIKAVEYGGNEDLMISVEGWYWSKGTEKEKAKDSEQAKINRTISYTKTKKHNIVEFDKLKKKNKW